MSFVFMDIRRFCPEEELSPANPIKWSVIKNLLWRLSSDCRALCHHGNVLWKRLKNGRGFILICCTTTKKSSTFFLWSSRHTASPHNFLSIWFNTCVVSSNYCSNNTLTACERRDWNPVSTWGGFVNMLKSITRTLSREKVVWRTG